MSTEAQIYASGRSRQQQLEDKPGTCILLFRNRKANKVGTEKFSIQVGISLRESEVPGTFWVVWQNS
jgi:hypothetical protein